MENEDNLYNEYIDFFVSTFGTEPEYKFCGISALTELIALRNEYQDKIPRPNVHDYETKEQIEIMLEKLKIITYKEYKKSKQKIN